MNMNTGWNFNPTGLAALPGSNVDWTKALSFAQNDDYGFGTDMTQGLVGQDSGLGFNMDTLKLGFGALGALGSIYNGFNANKLANKQYKLAKEMANANLTNQIKSYNTALEDRIRSRYGVEGRSQEEADAYISANKLTR